MVFDFVWRLRGSKDYTNFGERFKDPVVIISYSQYLVFN
jgi:hypothetical protein